MHLRCLSKTSFYMVYRPLSFWKAQIWGYIIFPWILAISLFPTSLSAPYFAGFLLRSCSLIGVLIRAKYDKNRLNTFQWPRKEFNSVIVFWSVRPRISSIVCCKISSLPDLITFPHYSILSAKNHHLLFFEVTPAVAEIFRTRRKFFLLSSTYFNNTTIYSTYSTQYLNIYVDSIRSMARWNVSGHFSVQISCRWNFVIHCGT